MPAPQRPLKGCTSKFWKSWNGGGQAGPIGSALKVQRNPRHCAQVEVPEHVKHSGVVD